MIFSMETTLLLPPQLDIYKASAGSGKTFLLTIQYLKLLLEYPLKYREILAITFTNKATEEMRSRILNELQALANGKKTIYGRMLLEEIKSLSEEDLQQYATKVYSSILHDYSRFNISTIDSFVQSIVRSFAYEIGLDAGFKLQLDISVVKEDIAERLYTLLDTNESLRNWVIEMASARLEEGKNWDFKHDMFELAEELFKEQFQDFDLAMNNMCETERTTAFKTLRDHIYTFIKTFETQQIKLGKAGINLVNSNNLELTDFHYGSSGFIKHFYKAAANKSEAAGTRVKQFLTNPEKAASTKATPYKKDIINSINGKLHDLMQQLVDHYDKNIKTLFTAKSIKKNLYILQLMQVLSNELANYRSDNNALLINDTHLLLRQLSRENEASFIFEKTGNKYAHFLIDEFQDTSVFQWDNFKPLLENSLGQGYYNLIVGDVKQSIYRWRSGDWRLLLSEVKKQLSSFDVQENSLQHNYRSAKHIIHFNNYLFATIPARLQEKFNQDILAAPDEIQQRLRHNNYFSMIENAYIDSFQYMPESSPDEGLVSIQFLSDVEDEEQNKISFVDQVLKKLPVLIENLIQKNGYSPKDITILARDNREARQVMQCIMTHQQQPDALKYNIISADALYIGGNEAIQIIIAAMRWLANENDILSKVFLTKTMASKNHAINLTKHQLYANNKLGDQVLPFAFINNKTTLQKLPLIELVNSLIDIFILHHQPSNHAYLLAFQDMVLEWTRQGEDGLLAFLNYWDTDGIKKSLPFDNHTNALEIMTIHKSKGLAFEVLLLPFCNWTLEPDAKKNNWLWVNTKGTAFDEIPVVPVKYTKDLAQSDYAYAYFEEQLLSQMDALNMLYVALTRAKRQIISFATLPKNDDYKIKTVGDLIYDVLHHQMISSNASIPKVFESFNDNLLLFGTLSSNVKRERPTQKKAYVNNIIYNDWKQHLNIRPASMLLKDEAVSLPRTKGILLHEALSLLLHPDELSTALYQMIIKGKINTVMKKEMEKVLKPILQNELFINWKNGTMRRLSERDILTSNRKFKRPDLVLINDNEAIVVDFKFTEEKDNRLKRQVIEYVELLKEMKFKNVRCYLLYGLTNEIELIM